jgi:hypothetical protein
VKDGADGNEERCDNCDEGQKEDNPKIVIPKERAVS